MLGGTPTPIDSRLDSLEKHLKRENPALMKVVRSYRELDKVAYGLGVLNPACVSQGVAAMAWGRKRAF